MLFYSNPPDGFWEHEFTDGWPTDVGTTAIALLDCFRRKDLQT